MSTNEKRWKAILPFCLILAALVFAGIKWGGEIVSLVADPVAFREWVDARGVWGPVAMIAIVAVQILVALIPGEPFEFAAGYAFGVWEGMFLCLAGSLVGGWIAMMLARKFGLKLVKSLFPKQDIENLAIFQKPDRLKILTFILFLIPGTPKDVMIYALGLTPMGIWQGVLLSTVARIPSIITSTMSGHALGEEQYLAAAIIYGITGVISLIIILIYRRKNKMQ